MDENFTYWFGHRVIMRLPYAMTTEVVIAENAQRVLANELDLVHRMDKPFHVQDVVLRFTALDEHGAVIDPQPTVLDRFVTMQLTDNYKHERVANDLPFRRLPGGEVIWKPKSPLVIAHNGSFEALFNARATFAITGTKVPIKALQIRLSLEGETLILVPSAETSVDAPSPAA